ncbi:MAG: Gfo/Idh/MocA family protein [Myxococcota bacterium]
MSAVLEKQLVVVGYGDAGSRHRVALGERAEWVVCGIVEPAPAAAARALEEGLRVFPDVESLVASGAVPDVALICTPSGRHREVCEPLLLAGTDCLVERPLATHPVDAAGLTELAERLGRTLQTLAPFRSDPALLEVRRVIDRNQLGRLAYIEVNLECKRDPRSDWRGDPMQSGGGVWMDHGADAIDAVETLAGAIERIRMLEERRPSQAAVESDAVVEAEHPNGILSRIHVSWSALPSAPLVRCAGTAGEIRLGLAQTVLRTDERERVIGHGYDEAMAVRAAVRDFCVARVRASEEDPGALSVDWLHAAYRSLHSGRWEIA